MVSCQTMDNPVRAPSAYVRRVYVRRVDGHGGSEWEDAVAECGDLLAVGQLAVLGVGAPSFGQPHEPFDNGRRRAWVVDLDLECSGRGGRP